MTPAPMMATSRDDTAIRIQPCGLRLHRHDGLEAQRRSQLDASSWRRGSRSAEIRRQEIPDERIQIDRVEQVEDLNVEIEPIAARRSIHRHHLDGTAAVA